jgi:hypothetical protein
MLIIGFILALCFYVGLFFVYEAAQSHILGPLEMLNKMLFMPEPTIFLLLRGLIIITLFYIVADSLISPARRGLKSRRQKQEDARRDKMAFRGVKPPREAIEDNDDDSIEHPTLAPPRFSS